MVHDLRTQRLVLRPLEASDADRLHALFNNWNVIRRLSSPPWPYTLKDTHNFVCRQTKNANDLTKMTFAITLEGLLIGGIDISVSNSEPRRRGPSLGYWLGEDFWGHGYMTEAARGFLAHVFAANVSEVICSGVFADNAVSLRVQEKLGFVREEEIMMFAEPHGVPLPHINTVLTRVAFNEAAA